MGELQRPPTRRFLPESSSLCAQDRNIQLAFYSIIIYFPMAVQQTNFDILAGFTPLVWFVSCLHAAGGILVALSVLYSSSVTKTVAVSGALVIVNLIAYAVELSLLPCVFIFTMSFVGQFFAHWVTNERTFQSTYKKSPQYHELFLEHVLLVIPLVVDSVHHVDWQQWPS